MPLQKKIQLGLLGGTGVVLLAALLNMVGPSNVIDRLRELLEKPFGDVVQLEPASSSWQTADLRNENRPFSSRDAGQVADGHPIGFPHEVDSSTAVYDIAAHTVYLPDGLELEAHSGLGARLDDPRFVHEHMRGATPPSVYELIPREKPFHGVRALRLIPVGNRQIFGRKGLLAHTYMLGPKGDSNGCVVFKNYNAFLQAFDSGKVRRLLVVAHVD